LKASLEREVLFIYILKICNAVCLKKERDENCVNTSTLNCRFSPGKIEMDMVICADNKAKQARKYFKIHKDGNNKQNGNFS
jgi:hypothetical protein